MSGKRRLVWGCWVVLGCLVAAGSLLPAGSPVLAAAGSLPVSDKAMHFLAYLGLAVLPVVGFADRRRGLVTGLGIDGGDCDGGGGVGGGAAGGVCECGGVE